MPEVVRGSRSGASAPATPADEHPPSPGIIQTLSPLSQTPSEPPRHSFQIRRASHAPHDLRRAQTERPEPGRKSSTWRRERRDSIRNLEADVYYDSRAATKTEFRRRATTLQEYYRSNPSLLPQLPFTWHHGWRRFRLGLVIVLIFLDSCVLPIALYYGMKYGGHVQGWIIFAIVTTIWGGPTYLEALIRAWRLIKKERFYRPLGTNSRWCFDFTFWVSNIAIVAVTTLFIVGSAPHIVWLRVLSMPAPALLYAIAVPMLFVNIYSICGWKAPFRLSSTGKGEPVRPSVYYIVEDVVAVNAGAGRPFREAFAARYEASERFRQMIFIQSWFWSVSGVVVAIPLTVIAVRRHIVHKSIAYGICWAVPFVWAALWAFISTIWCKYALMREREEWEEADGVAISDAAGSDKLSDSPGPDPDKVEAGS